MKNLSKLRKTVAAVVLVVGVSIAYPTYAKFIGWEQDSAFAFSCNGSGAYTMVTETYYLFGIAIDTKTTYYGANGLPLAGDPCSTPVSSN